MVYWVLFKLSIILLRLRTSGLNLIQKKAKTYTTPSNQRYFAERNGIKRCLKPRTIRIRKTNEQQKDSFE